MMVEEKENISIFNVGMGDVIAMANGGDNISTFIGIDVGKFSIDVYCSLNNKYYSNIPNDRTSIKSLINNDLKKIKGLDPLNTLAVIDLTGNYEALCRDMFQDSGFTNIHLAEGKKVNYFKRSKKHNLAKTDKMDSYILSVYGKENLNSLKLYEPNINTKDLSSLRAMEGRLEELKQILVQEKNRLQVPELDNLLRKDINLSLRQLEGRIKKLEKESTSIVENNKELKKRYDILINQRGISSITARILIAFLPELGTVNKRQISSISGTAPVCKDSGTSRGYRGTRGTGRHIIKKALFIVLLSHIRYDNSILSKFYSKLLRRGKPKKVAIVACMRKFIIYLNSLLRKEIGNNSIMAEDDITINDVLKAKPTNVPVKKGRTNNNSLEAKTTLRAKTANVPVKKGRISNNTSKTKTNKYEVKMKHYA
jgi:transposase